MKSIVVYCGSSSGNQAIYKESCLELAQALAKRNIDLVYGAGNVGLMGILADEVLRNKGKAIGVIPKFLKEKEVCHHGLTELYVTETMSERKTIMNDLADAIITLPGGYGTLEELSEMLTAAQLSLHAKPIGILNINGYFDNLLAMINTMVDSGFLKAVNKNIFQVSTDVDDLLSKMSTYEAKLEEKWIA